MPAPNRKITVRVNPSTGLMEGINPDGTVSWVQNANKSAMSETARRGHQVSTRLYNITTASGEVITLPYDPSFLKAHRSIWPYAEEVGLEIARRLAEGETLKAICSSPGLPPYYIVGKWRNDIPGFKTLLDEARRIRAEMFHDEMVEVKDDVEESTAKSSKVKLDALKHLAAVNDPDTYGSKTKITGDPNAPLNFVFNTGIERRVLEDNPPIPAEGGTIDDDDEQDG